MLEGYLNESIVRRIAEDTPLVVLVGIQSTVVVVLDLLQYLVCRVVGLNDDSASIAMTTCTTADLRELLESIYVNA